MTRAATDHDRHRLLHLDHKEIVAVALLIASWDAGDPDGAWRAAEKFAKAHRAKGKHLDDMLGRSRQWQAFPYDAVERNLAGDGKPMGDWRREAKTAAVDIRAALASKGEEARLHLLDASRMIDEAVTSIEDAIDAANAKERKEATE